MAKHRQPTRQQLDSLIPALKTEEKRLDDLLVQARAEAETTMRDAEREARARIARTLAGLPALVEARRAERRTALQQEAAGSASEDERRARDAERRAQASLEAAADWIVSLVWPGSPPGARRAAP